MKRFLAIMLIGYMCVGCGGGDIDENTYKTVTIHNQVWMAENLHTFYFRNGDPIPVVKNVEKWIKAGENKQPACCYYENKAENGEKYGVLYNWYAVNDPRGLAPNSWHIPTKKEWTELIDYFGGKDVAGTKMKSTSGWNSYSAKQECPQCSNWSPSEKAGTYCERCDDKREIESELSGNGTNESGFNGLSGGFCYYDDIFTGIGIYGGWWSADGMTHNAWNFNMLYNYGGVDRDRPRKKDGLSVRCVKD